MKRLLALLLCVATLVCLLAACNNNPGTNPGETTTKPKKDDTVDGLKLTQYTIVYPKKASATVKDAAQALAATIQPMIEDEVKITTDEDSITADPEAKEILIGSTAREASVTYYTAFTPSYKFSVYKEGNKIVLAGYTDALVAKAVSFFAEEYVNRAEDGIIADVVDYEGTFDRMLTLTEAKSSDFRVVYQKNDLQQIPFITDTVDGVVAKINARTDVKLSYAYSSAAYSADKKEIMIGRFSHSALSNAYNELKLGGYLISVLENKILIAATSEVSYKDSVLALDKLITANTLYGTKNVAFEVGTTTSSVTTKLLEKLPVASLSPKNIVPTGNDCEIAIFEGASQSFFDEYVAKLKAAGFTEYSRTNFNGSNATQKNSFGTYVTDDCSVDLGYHENFKRMYLSVSPRDKLTLPETKAPSYTPAGTQYPVLLTQVGTYEFHPTEHAMCYVIRLADGSFIIYDTSYGQFRPSGQTKNRQVAEEIYDVLRAQAPDPNNIVISAIFITHPHGDHMGGFLQFANLYANNPKITLKQFVYNFPSVSACPNQSERNNIPSTENALKKFGAKVEVVKPRSGNVLYYPGVKFNVLYTQEDYMAVRTSFGYGNVSSFVMQMITDGGVKVLIGGDNSVDGSTEGIPFCEGAIHKWYGSFIESEIVTLFHHGLGGGADDIVYSVIKPKLVLWPGTWERIVYDSSHTPYGTPLDKCSRNAFFVKGLENAPDVWHTTPSVNGVHGWFVADDGIQVVTFVGSSFGIAAYGTRDAYLGPIGSRR